MGEGATGLHRCDRLAKALGLWALYVKNEGENPTGSFKDRGMTVGVTRAVELGARTVACASTGNTAASMAAYAAKAGLDAIVLLPSGKVAAGKVAQAVVHGARLVQIDGNFDDAMRVVQELSLAKRGPYLLNSINPFRLEGQKTLAFELMEALGRAPDAVVLPMGNAGNISAIWKGFREFGGQPRMIGVQAAGAAPIVNGRRVERPETVATAIRIGSPVSWKKAVSAIRESNGHAGTVTDAEILRAQRDLAELEGLFVEPASAAPIAYLRKHRVRGTVVAVATGHGLKDPDAVTAPRLIRAKPTLASLRRAL
jgi:threonine synthase